MSIRIFTSILNKIMSICAVKPLRQMVACTIVEFANHLALVVCFRSHEKWVQREKYPSNHIPPKHKCPDYCGV